MCNCNCRTVGNAGQAGRRAEELRQAGAGGIAFLLAWHGGRRPSGPTLNGRTSRNAAGVCRQNSEEK